MLLVGLSYSWDGRGAVVMIKDNLKSKVVSTVILKTWLSRFARRTCATLPSEWAGSRNSMLHFTSRR